MKLKIIILVIITVFLSLSGCIHDNNDNDINQQKFEELWINIRCLNDTTGYILLPVLVNDESDISRIYKELKNINNNGTYNFQDSAYGTIINISINNDVELYSKRNLKNEEYKYYYWSTLISEKKFGINGIYVFSSCSNINVTIEYDVNYGETSRKSEYMGCINIKNTWMKISGYDMLKSK